MNILFEHNIIVYLAKHKPAFVDKKEVFRIKNEQIFIKQATKVLIVFVINKFL